MDEIEQFFKCGRAIYIYIFLAVACSCVPLFSMAFFGLFTLLFKDSLYITDIRPLSLTYVASVFPSLSVVF